MEAAAPEPLQRTALALKHEMTTTFLRASSPGVTPKSVSHPHPSSSGLHHSIRTSAELIS